jgi:hypothetical protein
MLQAGKPLARVLFNFLLLEMRVTLFFAGLGQSE